MRRMGWFLVPVIAVALLIGGAFGAAVANHDTEHDDRAVQITVPAAESGGAPQIITIDRGNDHWGHGGFFPFGFLFPLFWIGLIIFLFSAFFRRGRWGGPGGWGGGGPGRWDDRFTEWHRRQHEGDSPPQQPGPAASV